jgi:large subunit ribosomal protein L19
MAMMHHGKRPRFRGNPKFKSPRKRASGLLDMLNKEHVEKSIHDNPLVWKTEFRVGDAIEILYVDQGGISSNLKDKMRGVVLGKVNRGLNTSVYIRDVVYGEPIDRKIHLHSPLFKSLTVLEENFVFKKRKKVKRAKLYYLRERLPTFTKVTKW